jgi:hypothetical protein
MSRKRTLWQGSIVLFPAIFTEHQETAKVVFPLASFDLSINILHSIPSERSTVDVDNPRFNGEGVWKRLQV